MKKPATKPVPEPETRMQRAIQLFEEDFARWGLHVPEADAAARKSGAILAAGWHVLYDFGQDGRGEFLDYYAALRDGTDPAVTDDWHVRLYDTGDRVQLPTVLEAYMYSRDPTAEELARARRKFAGPQAPTAPPKPVSPRPANPQPASVQAASPPPPSPVAAPRMVAAKPAAPRPAGPPLPGPSPRPAARPAPSIGTPGIGTPGGMPRAMPGASPRQPAIAASAAPSATAPRPGSAGTPRSVAPSAQMAPASSMATALDDSSTASGDIALEVGLDLALAGVEPVPGGDTLASWLMTPAFGSAMIEPAKAAAPAPKGAPPPKPKPAPLADDDAQSPDLVFVSEAQPVRISGRISDPTPAITTDDDTFTISMSDDEAPDARDSLVATTVEGLDHYHTPTRSSGPAAAAIATDAFAADAIAADALALDSDVVSADEDVASIPPAERRQSLGPSAMLTTDIAAVAGSFDPWWYRPTTRRIAMLAAAVIAVILVGSAVSHFRSSPAPGAADSDASPAAAHTGAAHAAAAPAPNAAGDPADASDATDSAQPGEGTAPDTLPVASAPSSVTADPANPAADDGIARPAGPQSVPPIQRSGTPRAPLGSGRTTAKTGSALP